MSIIPYGRTYEQENPHRPTVQSPLAGSPVLADLEHDLTSPSAPPSIASFQTEEQYSISSGGQDFERKPWDFLDNEEEEIMDQPLGDNPPVIVIIPSSFSNESLYEEAISRLETVGYEVIFAQLPSIVRREELSEKLKADKKNITLATMEDDARFIKEISTLLSDDGKDVVLVSHSYSGIPMTESVQGSTKHEREAEGKVGGVVALVYISAFIPTLGESLMTRMMELHPGETDISHIDEYGIMSLDPVVNARSTFSDLPEDEGVAWSNKMENHSAIAFAGKTSYEGWRYIPVTYLHTENDKVIPLRVQIDMVEQVRESGINVEVVTCGAGHCPNVSAVEEFVEAVRKGAGERRALSKPKTSIYVETNTQVVTEQYSQEPNGHPPLEPNGEDQNYYRDVRTLVSEFERMGR